MNSYGNWSNSDRKTILDTVTENFSYKDWKDLSISLRRTIKATQFRFLKVSEAGRKDPKLYGISKEISDEHDKCLRDRNKTYFYDKYYKYKK